MAKLTLEQLKRKIERWGGVKGRLALMRGMEMVGEEVIAYARRTHLHGPRMPQGVSGGLYGSTLDSKTGMRHRITKKSKIIGTDITVSIGTNLTNAGVSYPRLHEYGIGKMPERPWLRPSVYKKRKRLMSEIKRQWVAAYGR